MRTLLPILTLLVLAAAVIGQDASTSPKGTVAKPAADGPVQPAPAAQKPSLPPKTGSHISPDDNLCVQCHGDPDLWDAKTKHFYIARDELAQDVHWTKGVNCSDCHGGNPSTTEVNEAHAKESGFRGAAGARKICAVCHEKQGERAAHGHPRPRRRDGRAGPRHACSTAASVTAKTRITSCR